ncbi:MAG: hypothetical protein HOI15_01395 [Opitutales bacterium]|nr:hypothetical protein [Opitutales bacterium]
MILSRCNCSVLLTLVCLTLTWDCILRAGTEVREFDIAEGQAVETLKEAAFQGNVEILISVSRDSDVRTNSIKGAFGVQEALDSMLEGTPFVAVPVSNGNAFGIMKRAKKGGNDSQRSENKEPNQRPQKLDPKTKMNLDKTKKNRKTGGLFKGLLGIAIAVSPNLDAQDDSSGDDEVYELSPFAVDAQANTGYRATSTLAGTRLKTELRDLGGAISVMTQEFFEDTGATDAESALAYGLNTEISGLNGNFADVNLSRGVSDTTAARREPHKANRVRGLAEATLTRGQFLTDIPFDGYNTGIVTVNRGPNSLLFGIGSPGGVIDNSLKMASLGKDFGEISIRLGERGSHRETIDYNKVLLEDRLALRIAAMNEETNFEQSPAFEEDNRFYAAFDAVLLKNENSNFFGRTSLRGSTEYGKIEGTPVNIIPPADALKGWFQNDHYSRSQEQYTGVPLPGWVDDGSFVPRRTIDNFEVARQFGGQVPGGSRFSLGGAMTFQTYWDWVPLIFDSPSTDTPNQGLGGSYSDVAGVLGRWRSQGAATEDNPWVEHWSNWPLEQHGAPMPGFATPVVDPRVLDNRRVLLSGTTSSVETEFDANGLTFEQLFLDGKAGLELTYDKQEYDLVDTFALPSNRWNMVWIDINETLGNGSPNPNVGRPMMIATRGQGIPQNSRETERESRRATAFYELDFQEREDAMKWLGKHTFTGLLQNDTVDNESLNTNLEWGPFDTFSELHNGSKWNSGWGPLPVWYVGPDLRNTTNYLDVRLDQPITSRLPQAGDSYQVITTKRIGPDYTDNGDGTRGDVYNLQIRREALGGNRTRQKLESEALSVQSYFLDGYLTSLVGWRTDETYGYDRAGAARNSDGTWAIENQQLESDPNPTVSGNTFTWGAVAHFPEEWLFDLPNGVDLSFHYNESENFSPLVGRKNLRGEEMPAPLGSTMDYGFLLELMDRKLSVRVNWFELTSQFSSFSAGFTNSAANFPTTYAGFARDAKLQPIDFDEFISNQRNPEQAAADFSSWDDLTNAYLSAQPTYYSSQSNPRFDPPGSDNLVFDSIPGLSSTTDFESEGIEVDIAGQLTESWRVILNVGQQETIQTNTARGAIAMFNETKANLISANVWDIQFNPTGQEVTVAEHYDRIATDVAAAQAKDGTVSQELREWRINLITNYTFQDGLLKNFSAGGAARWQDDIAIGYPTIVESNGAFLPVIERPYFGPNELNFDVWFSFHRPINQKINWKAQLNIRNAFGDDDYIPVIANPDGQYASFRNPNPQQIFLTNTFSF